MLALAPLCSWCAATNGVACNWEDLLTLRCSFCDGARAVWAFYMNKWYWRVGPLAQVQSMPKQGLLAFTRLCNKKVTALQASSRCVEATMVSSQYMCVASLYISRLRGVEQKGASCTRHPQHFLQACLQEPACCSGRPGTAPCFLGVIYLPNASPADTLQGRGHTAQAYFCERHTMPSPYQFLGRSVHSPSSTTSTSPYTVNNINLTPDAAQAPCIYACAACHCVSARAACRARISNLSTGGARTPWTQRQALCWHRN